MLTADATVTRELDVVLAPEGVSFPNARPGTQGCTTGDRHGTPQGARPAAPRTLSTSPGTKMRSVD
ncbi:protein of unknown function [Caballeronia sp. S22]